MDWIRAYGKTILKPIVIGAGCWIASTCTITAGTKIGKGTLITANSVTRGEIPQNVIYENTKNL